MTINNFQEIVSNQLYKMIQESDEIFYGDIDKDVLWNIYLESFPDGTNPMYRERTVHDCNSCKRFIRQAGNIVAVINGELVTVWDVQHREYQPVADALADKVRFSSIAGIFRNREKTVGSKPHEETLANGVVNDYIHFHVILPSKFVTADKGAFQGNALANKEVLERSLREITLEASELLIEEIKQNQLYKGAEYLHKVESFYEVKTRFENLSKSEENLFLWIESAKLKEAGRFKNTVIGTILYDISMGTPFEDARAKYESKVAPSNYKRPKKAITQKMIDRATEKVEELGIEKSLDRRYAIAKDLTLNNVLFVDKGTKKKMKKSKKKKSVLGDLKPTKTAINSDKLQKVPIDEFVSDILPHATSLEVMIQNSHINDLMSLISPVHKRSPNIMKHGNPHSWTYNGDFADSIKERVKKAGGNISGYLRISLSWDCPKYTDLDLYVVEPNGNKIWYGEKRSNTGGFLDVDANAEKMMLNAVENTAWNDKSRILEGDYRVYVENYNMRSMDYDGFQLEMELGGTTSLFVHDQPLDHKEVVQVVSFNYSHKNGVKLGKSLPSSQTSKEIWNVKTHEWTKVNMLMNSPNYWNGERVGNKHWFFILDGCLNPGKARGFYNEHLTDNLHDHRKVFEVLGSKMKAEYSNKQLSGVGFSSTQINSILCKVDTNRIVEITFAPSRDKRSDVVNTPPVPVTFDNKVVTCEVCKKIVFDNDSRLQCPHNCNIFHTSHFLEWIRVKEICPVCRKNVTQRQIDKVVQLITV